MNTASPGRHVAHHVESQHVERDAFGRQHPLGALFGVALADHQRADAVRIAETQDAVADHHGDHGVAAPAAPVNGIGGGENIGRRDARRADPLQFGREHVEQHFRIGSGIQMPAVLAHQHFGEFARIGQIAVVRRGRCRRANSHRTAAHRARCRRRRWDSGRGRCRHCP